MARVAVVGCWHQGTVLSACLAELGHLVAGVPDGEPAAEALEMLRPPLHEPGLAAAMRRGSGSGRLRYTRDLVDALEGAELVFLSFDTQIGDDDAPQLSMLRESAAEIGQALRGPATLVVTSQVPVGTSDELVGIVQRNGGVRCDLAYVPEFLQLGRALQTFRRADRIVIGADREDVADRIVALFEPLGRPIIRTSVRAAEMGKHACNSFLAVSVAFSNEIADACDLLGVDVTEVVEVMRTDSRIGRKAFLSPGLGFAGGTLGRDLRALQELARERGGATPLIDAVFEANRRRPGLVLERLTEDLSDLRDLEVGVLGLTYKPGTSTLRRSTALQIIGDLVFAGASVRAHDPLADLTSVQELPPFRTCRDAYETAAGADALVLLTEWPDMRALDFRRLRRSMRGDVFLDTRNFLDPDTMRLAGFRYQGIGRGRIHGRGPSAVASSSPATA